jgi:hypothetical protein
MKITKNENYYSFLKIIIIIILIFKRKLQKTKYGSSRAQARLRARSDRV